MPMQSTLMTAVGSCPYDGDHNGQIDVTDVLNVVAGYGLGCP